MSVALKNPHFYSPFSIGLTLLSLELYRLVFKKSLFENWTKKQHTVFWILLLVACFICDQIGMYLQFWHYPHYSGILDEVIKITLEFAVPFIYFLAIYFTSKKLIGFGATAIITIPVVLIFSEYINSFSDSWVVTMPMWIWYSLGSWLMTLIPLVIYKIVK